MHVKGMAYDKVQQHTDTVHIRNLCNQRSRPDLSPLSNLALLKYVARWRAVSIRVSTETTARRRQHRLTTCLPPKRRSSIFFTVCHAPARPENTTNTLTASEGSAGGGSMTWITTRSTILLRKQRISEYRNEELMTSSLPVLATFFSDVSLQIVVYFFRTRYEIRKTDDLARLSVLLLLFLLFAILVGIDQFALRRARLHPSAFALLFCGVNVFGGKGMDNPVALFSETLALLMTPSFHH